MKRITTFFTDNARQDLIDILFFQVFEQKIPENIAIEISESIQNKASNILVSLPFSGRLYGYKGEYEVRTIVIKHKYMVYYIYNETINRINILHVFCTLMDDEVLKTRLFEEGIYPAK